MLGAGHVEPGRYRLNMEGRLQKVPLHFDWDSESNMDAFRKSVAGLLKRCGCKTWCHQTHQYGCKGKGKACGEGCNCTNCKNTDCCTTAAATNGTEDASIEEVITDALPENLDEIME